ncbi:MAG: hypothetical protein ABH864_05485 [archaeon]
MNWKKAGVYSLLLLMVVVPLLAGGILAADGDGGDAGDAGSAGVNQEITSPEWVVAVIKFLGLGRTWAMFIVSIAVLLMVFAATYDILAFTAFSTDWVKYLIAAGVALVVAVTRGVTVLAGLLMTLVGGSIIIGTFVSVILAVILFVISGWFKGKAIKWKAHADAEKARGGFELAQVATAGEIGTAKAAAAAAERKARK